MRLWSIHPKYLDTKGLIAVWREALLAKAVLEGKTKGYKFHPQLTRFKNFSDPIKAINLYLFFIFLEAKKRNYDFDKNKFYVSNLQTKLIAVSKNQVSFEFFHLLKKLKKRDKKTFNYLSRLKLKDLELNPIFYLGKTKFDPG